MEIIACPVCLLLQQPQGTDKLGKFLEHKPVPSVKVHFLVLREMNAAQGIIVLCQLIAEPQRLRQQFPLQRQTIQCLADCLHDRIVGEAAGQRVDRLHGMELLLILGRGVENLRVLHDKAALFPGHKSAQGDDAAPCQCVPKKGHAEPDHFQCAADILQTEGRNLHGPVP